MARLTNVCRGEDIINIGRRQLPVVAGENLMMLMDLNSKGLAIDSPQIRGKELEEFTRKFNLLTTDELHQSLEIDSPTFISVLNQCVQCVGCRRRVERLFSQLTLSGHPTLDPLVLKNTRTLSLTEEKMKTPQTLGTVLYRHHDVLNNLLESKLRNKTRCLLHSLDTFRSKPFSDTWREVWSSMKHNCRDELAVIDTKELHDVLENYLKKHKFCQGCRTKIEKAYKILVGETTSKEKGFVAALYANIKKCHPDKHIHVYTNKVDFLDALIRRAEPEVNGSYSKQRERHAKTLEIAQEEVLTCVGMIMYERLRRIYVNLREEERACQVLAAVGVHALCRSFDMFVEKKQGISNLELLYQEISRAEKAKEHKREQKKLKKKRKKIEKKNTFRASCESNGFGSDMAEADEEEDQDEAVDVSEDIFLESGSSSIQLETGSTAASAVEAMAHEPTHSGCESIAANIDHDDDGDDEEEQLRRLTPTPPKSSKKKKPQKQKQKQKQKPSSKKSKQPLNNNHNTNSNINKKGVNSSCNSGKSLSPSVILTRTPHEHAIMVTNVPEKCNECLAPTSNCPCESDVKDSGYGSEPNSHVNSRTSSVASTPEGSEISCAEGFCNHERNNTTNNGSHDLEDVHLVEQPEGESEGCYLWLCQPGINTLSLQQMLDNIDDEEEDDENCYIPQEVVLEYQCQREKVEQLRLQLRETLRQNYARLCMQQGPTNCK